MARDLAGSGSWDRAGNPVRGVGRPWESEPRDWELEPRFGSWNLGNGEFVPRFAVSLAPYSSDRRH